MGQDRHSTKSVSKMQSAREKIYLKGRRSGWVDNFAIFVRVSEEGLKENFPDGNKPGKRGKVKAGRKRNDPEAGVCLAYSRIVWLGQSKAKSGS